MHDCHLAYIIYIICARTRSTAASTTAAPFAICLQTLGITVPAEDVGGGVPALFPDEAVLALCKRLIRAELSCSYRLAAAFVAHAILPRLATLQRPVGAPCMTDISHIVSHIVCAQASRALLGAVLHASSAHPKAVLEELVLPLFAQPADLGAAQVPIQRARTL